MNTADSNIPDMFSVHYRGKASSPGSFNECRLSVRWSQTLVPSQLTWAVSQTIFW